MKKQLVLEGFSVREEWLDLDRSRPWSNAWNADKDVLWQDEYSAQENAAAGQ